jgi:site-specific DNA-methyltransferase (adenine-specific)
MAARMIEPVTIGPATLYNADALAVLLQLCGFDALLTGPPYSSGGQFRSDRVRNTRKKCVFLGSSSETLPDFGGDNRAQRAFAYWAALWSAAALQACRPAAWPLYGAM